MEDPGPPLESIMMHPDDVKTLAIMATLIMLCALTSALARPAVFF